LLRVIEVLESCLGKTARKIVLPLQPGDVLETYADVDQLMKDTGFRPSTPIESGIERFVHWYRSYYNAQKKIDEYARPAKCDGAAHAK
jgi:UDP-glucuronate 4-epimerase